MKFGMKEKPKESMIGRVNVYVCEYNCLTVTVDRDEGVTPFMIGCKSRNRPERPIKADKLDSKGFCIGTARSSFYPKGPVPSHIGQPKWEWVLPNKEQVDEMIKEHPEREAEIREYYDGSHLTLVEIKK